MNVYSTFAPFSQRGLPSGAVETSCDRCGEIAISGQPGRDSLLDAVVWARDHTCPPPVARIPVSELIVRAGPVRKAQPQGRSHRRVTAR